MTRRNIGALILVLFWLVPLCGCLDIGSVQPVCDPAKYQQQFQDNHYYSTLNEELKQCYGSIYTALMDGASKDETVLIGETSETETVTHPYPGIQVRLPNRVQTKEEIDQLYQAFFLDNPEFFYVRHVYGMMGYAVQDQVWYDTLVLTYTGDATHRAETTKAIETAVTSILAERPVTEDEYLTELYLHDRLIGDCTYDYTAAESGYESIPQAYTAYGALVDGSAVCEGYAKAMQLLLKRCGITAVLVTGQSVKTGEQHMWNRITIHGETYHLDPTWNDTDDRVRHAFFNVTDDRLAETHVTDTAPSDTTRCTAVTDNYFVRSGTYINTYERQSIAAAIANRVNSGDTTIELCFSPDTFDNGLLFLKNVGMTYKLTNPLLTEETTVLWEYTLTGDSTMHLLTMTKK